MAIDKTAFMFIVGSLAAGGAGGYYYATKSPPRSGSNDARSEGANPSAAAVVPTNAPSTVTTASASVVPAVVGPACDDMVGSPAECPSVAPSSADEGICGGNGSIAVKRCHDFKLSFKPRIAELAVACIRKLAGGQLCDPTPANLCGHEALMLACHEPVSPAQGALTSANIAAAPTDPNPASSSPVATQCAAILKGCTAAPLPISLSDCLRTLSGMTESGRAGMVACMKTSCETKGLLGCEGLPPPA